MRSSNQRTIIRFTLIALLTFFAPQNLFANTWPHLDGDQNNTICRDAFKIADSVYNSDVFFLYKPHINKLEADSNFVFTQNESPESYEMFIDDATIEEIHIKSTEQPTLYWERKPKHNLRLVLTDTPFSWRGNIYELYAIDINITPDAFIKIDSSSLINSISEPIIKFGWNPPFLLKQKHSNELWAIDVGHPADALASWDVYGFHTDNVEKICSISFRNEATHIIDLLPPEVRKFAILLKSTHGDGKDEGTLQPSARLRAEAEYVWANIIMRPWIRLNEPYNTRVEVDTGLKKWSNISKGFRRLYWKIYTQYPKAEQELKQYYKTKFNKDDEEAGTMAKQSLDVAFRTYFTFSK